MDSRETFSPTHPRTPPIHPYPYAFPTSSFRDGPPPSQSQVPSPLPHPESPIPQPNLSLPILPTTPLNRPRLGSPSQDDGNVVVTKPQSEPETRTEGPSRPTMPPRPPNIRVPQWKYSCRAVKGDNQVEVPKCKPENCMKSSRHPSSRRDSLVANVEDWLAGVAAARVGVEGRNGGAPKPNGIPPPRPPRPSTPPSPSPAPRPRPRLRPPPAPPAPPAVNTTKEADPGPRMNPMQGVSSDVTARQRGEGNSSSESDDESIDTLTTTENPASLVRGTHESDTRLIESLTELQKTLASYKRFRDNTKGTNFICSGV